MRITSMTHAGGMEANKDKFGKICRDGIYCFVISDGGGVGGEEASRLAVEAALREFEDNPSVTKQKAEYCIQAAAEAIKVFIENDILYEHMYASAAVFITDGRKSVFAHVGNTRLYVLNKGTIKAVIPENDEENGRIDENSFCEVEASEVYAIRPKTSFLLCTDGFWKNIDKEDIELAAKNAKTSKEWLGLMLAALEEKAYDRCGNISAVTMMM